MTTRCVWASLGIRLESVGNPLGIRPESVGNPPGIRFIESTHDPVHDPVHDPGKIDLFSRAISDTPLCDYRYAQRE